MSVDGSITACVHTINATAGSRPSRRAQIVVRRHERRSWAIVDGRSELSTPGDGRDCIRQQAANTSRRRQTEETDAFGVHGPCRLSTETASIHNVGQALNVAGIAAALCHARVVRRRIRFAHSALASMRPSTESCPSKPRLNRNQVCASLELLSQASVGYRHSLMSPNNVGE
jgi:hypothetical protein